MNFDVTGKLINSGGGAVVPVGSVLDFAGITAPQHYLLCNGQAVSRTDYAELFAVIGTTWGAGNGSTTFNVPNLQGRTTIGVGTNDGTTYNLGSRDGSKNAVAVSHNHNITKNVGGTIAYGNWGVIYGSGYEGTPGSVSGNITLEENYNSHIGNWSGSGNYQRGRNVYARFRIPDLAMASAGESGTDKNMMPYGALNKIIRAK